MTRIYLALVAALLFASCGEDEVVLATLSTDDDYTSTTTVINESSVYESCCGKLPLTVVGQGFNLYAPSAFTPNADGLNDVFLPQIDEGVAGVSFEILDLNGEVVYTTGRRYPRAEYADYAWDGTRADGSAYEGAFMYVVDLYLSNGTPYYAEGSSCAVHCAGVDEIPDFSKCTYGDQVSAPGTYDRQLDSSDRSCD